MANMSDAKGNETIQQGDRNSLSMLDINDDIIDVSAIDFSDHDTWLQPPSLEVPENSIRDLGAWLKNNVDQECIDSQDSRRSIDTRTFTRPKKRLGRLSFESIGEATVPQSSNVWNRVAPSTKQDDKDNAESERAEKDSIPHMLRPTIPGVSSLFSSNSGITSGQESFEAFLNMSRSKGIDSFIDLAEPEFNDDIMDVSQPSVLYSSVLSVAADDSSQTTNQSLTLNQSQFSKHSGIEDSQILTESMMQTSMFGDVVDVNFNDTFAKNHPDVTVLENTNYCASMDATFVATTDTNTKDTMNGTFNTATFNRGTFQSIDATYTPSRLNVTLTNDPHASYIVNRSPFGDSEAKTSSVNDASYVINSESDKRNFLGINDIPKDASFVITRLSPDILDSIGSKVGEQNDTFNGHNFDATFEKTPVSLSQKSIVNSTCAVSPSKNVREIEEPIKQPTRDDIDTEMNRCNTAVLSRGPPSENLDSTFCKPAPKAQSKLNAPRPLSKLLEAPNTGHQNDTFNVQHLDATFEKTAVTSPKKSSLSSLSKISSSDHDRTFKAPTSEKVDVKMEKKNIDTISRGGSLDNLDATFDKPALKIHPQRNPPRPLSKLPQSFQKSNPNLGPSSLKYASTTTRSAIPSFGFNRPATRPSTTRNPESLQFASKILALGKLKSGSEQRLDVTRNASELQRAGSGGSTDSIDSTQSAHSAPDFDDRLSVRSDSSNTSYSMRTMNIEEFQKIVRMREECLKQESTPKPSRRVLENNWVATSNDLPSPILKNGPETYGSRGSSPRSMDSTVKTSSPLSSPTGSLQNLPIDAVEPKKDNSGGNKLMIPRNKSIAPPKISQASVKPPRNVVENRTGLRPPASWTSANRPASGIPRPASRIPGPRLVRPNTKSNQGDTKK